MSVDPARARLGGFFFGLGIWVAMAASAATLSALGVPSPFVTAFVVLAIFGFILFAVRSIKRR